MNYPIELLPNPQYKLIDCDLSKYFLIRYTKSKNNSSNSTIEVTLEDICSPREQIIDLSTSIYGIYKKEHINIEFTKEAKLKFEIYCDLDFISNEVPKYQIDFYSNNDRGYVLVPINDLIINQTLEISYNFRNIPKTIICNMEIQHTPMKWNFWHYSIRFKSKEFGYIHQIEDKKLKEKIAKQLGNEARSIISVFSSYYVNNITPISKHCYLKPNPHEPTNTR